MQSAYALWHWIGENQATALTLFISFLALVATALQARAARVQNQQSVRPFLYAYYTVPKDENEYGGYSYHIHLTNTGLGPALIEDYCVRHQNKEYRGDDIFDLFYRTFEKVSWIYVLRPHTSCAAQMDTEILKIPCTQANLAVCPDIVNLTDAFELIIVYKSFMNKKYTYSSKIHDLPNAPKNPPVYPSSQQPVRFCK